MPRAPLRADLHGYDPFVLEIDMKPFNANAPKITLQARGPGQTTRTALPMGRAGRWGLWRVVLPWLVQGWRGVQGRLRNLSGGP